MIIIGVGGIAKSGKDTFAAMLKDALVETGVPEHLILDYNFAEPVKHIARYVFNMSDEDVNTQEGKKAISKNGYGLTNREILQKVGTESFRDVFNHNIWVDVAERQIFNLFPANAIVIISDVRFNNEAEWILTKGPLIKIERPNMETIEQSAHASEQGFSAKPHLTITNDGSLDDLKAKAVLAAHSIRVLHKNALTSFNNSMAAAVMSHFAHGQRTL